MIVMKFGGSSIRDAQRIQQVGGIIHAHRGRHPILVCSAMGKTTDLLLEAGARALSGAVEIKQIKDLHLSAATQLDLPLNQIEALFAELEDLLKGVALLKELSRKTSDYLVSFGERLAVRIMASALAAGGFPARFFDAWDIGLLTDSNFGSAEVTEAAYANIAGSFADLKAQYSYLPVVTGFIAKDSRGQITTLGRGGSDLTASVIGAAVAADEIQVWKDVDGILTADPRIVAGAQPVPQITFEEAAELAYFGAKVLHPSSIKPAMDRSIPVRVKNSYNPDHPGTIVGGAQGLSANLLKAITCKRNVTLIDIVSTRMLGQYGFLAKVFDLFNEHKICVDVVATSEVSISLTVNNGVNLEPAVQDLESIAKVSVARGKALLSLIGNVERSSEILDRVFGAFSARGVNVQMISQGASKVNIGLIVEDREIEGCVREVHKQFFGV